MKFYEYLNEEKDVTADIIEFFLKNSNPKDDEIHNLADELGINKHKFEEVIYKLLGSFFGSGRSKDFKGTYDDNELSLGIDIEKEHTSSPVIAERIAKDHLAEIKDYYTRLKKMEEEAGIKD